MDGSNEKTGHERMNAAIETMGNKEIGSYEASKVFSLPQTTLQRYVKDRQNSSSEAIKTRLGRSKFFLVKQQKIWLIRVF
jgi:hypothetical protein